LIAISERENLEEHLRETPDWPIELSEPVARLGTPNEVFNIPRSHAARKAVSGISLIVGGGIANYIYFVVFNMPIGLDVHMLYLFLFGPIITGVGLMYAAWRDRGLWVLIFPMGILRWQRGEVVAFPWAEVREITFYRVVECDRPKRKAGPNREIITSWLPIAKMGSRTLGAHLIIRREDAAEAILPSSVGEFRRLCQVVQEETFRLMWPKVWARFIDGSRVKFGDLALSLAGISRDGDLLPWYELEDALVQNGKLVIRARRMHKPWLEVALHNLPNPHVFAALLIAGPQHARDAN
jgi:hypothetical protein